MANPSSPWLIRYRGNSSASLRLFCFHCAGGSASEFREWPAHLPGTIELVAVQLPGREGRVRDAFITSMDDLVDGAVDALTPLLDKPCAIFGHSLGALGAFEVIREMRRRGLPRPVLFIPAGRRGPQVEKEDPPIASLPEEEFLKELEKDYGDHLGHVLRNAELREAFIPQIRADFALSESYRLSDERPLDCPIVAFAGVSEDDLEADHLNAWSAHTNRRFLARRFPGDHFFIRESRTLVIDAIRQEIASVRREEPSGARPFIKAFDR